MDITFPLSTLVAIASYGEGPHIHLEKVLDTYESMTFFKVDVVVDHTHPIDIPKHYRIPVHFRLLPEKIQGGLPFIHRELFARNREMRNIFIYSENDLLITEENLLTLLEVTRRLPPGYISGFLRYEERDGERHLIDLNRAYPTVSQGVHEVNGLRWFSPANLHQGCTVLTQPQLIRALDSGHYDVLPHSDEKYGYLEAGATDAYSQCGFHPKLLPADDQLEKLLVHHLPNKYVHSGGIWENPGAHTVSSLRAFLGF